jgi:hypothetical protein
LLTQQLELNAASSDASDFALLGEPYSHIHNVIQKYSLLVFDDGCCSDHPRTHIRHASAGLLFWRGLLAASIQWYLR